MFLRGLTPVALLAATPLMAEPLPQGDFMLGTHIWPDDQLPRYATLHIKGETLDIAFSSAMPIDVLACKEKGDCRISAHAATMRATLEDGLVTLTDITLDDTAHVDPHLEETTGQSAATYYTSPLITLLNRAQLSPTETGFTLDFGAGTLDFYRGDETAFTAARYLPILYDQSAHALAGCEVRSILPMLQSPPQSGSEKRRHALLSAIAFLGDLEQKLLALPTDPYDPVQPKDRLALFLTLSLPSLIAIPGEPGEGLDLEAFWGTKGRKVFKDDRAGFDAAVASWGDNLEPLVAFLRRMRDAPTEVTPKAICADPLLGFR